MYIFCVFSAKQWLDLNHEWRQILDLGFRQGTWSAINRSGADYLQFADRFKFPAFPIETTRICLFAVHLALEGNIAATISQKLSHVSTYSQLVGHPPLNFQNIFVKLTLRGLRRSVRTRKSARSQGITLTMLKKIQPFVDQSHGIQVASWAAVLVAFFLLLRRSNLVPHHAKQFHADEQLVRNDLLFFNNMVLVNIKWSKTRQDGNRVTMPILRGPGRVDPIAALRKLLAITPLAEPHDPLFMFPRQGKKDHTSSEPYSILTADTVQSYLRTWLEKAGYRPYDFSMHGLRRGGATHAYNRRIPLAAIQLMGDWRSDAYKAYLEEDLAKRIGVAADLAAMGSV